MIQRYDIVVIGAGVSGEAAANYARARGASVALVEKDLIGGTCAYWGCMPSKALLHAAEVHHSGGDFPWPRASAFRDWMINREKIAYPHDHSHEQRLAEAGVTVIRGTARLAGSGRLEIEGSGGAARAIAYRDLVLAVGSIGKVPPIDGLREAGADVWSNVEATAARELPESMVILGAGPSGVELAQVYARYGVRTTIVSPRQVNPTDHPRSSEYLSKWLAQDGVLIRTGVRAQRVRPRAGEGGAHLVELSDGSTVDGQVIQLAVGRTSAPALREIGLDTIGVRYEGADTLQVDDRLRAADHVYAVGDAIGHELSTHLGHYEGELAVRIALGDDVRADFRATPRCVYTDPETAAVGLRVEEAREQGFDAYEETAEMATSAKGYVTESEGHATIVVDRASGTLAGAFIAGVGAAEAIHVAVLAVKLRTPLAVLADTIHAFPTTARVLGGLFALVGLPRARESGS